ncbi:MAG TPA: hypothetical protein ENN29_02490 [Candidatus Hydrogenedentes bacterium]|nr:hypothetical protein [Candidatus Hydrogenedentota bacterium]
MPLCIEGITVIPHMMVESMRYAQEPEPAVGARVQLFVRNAALSGAPPLVLDGQTRTLFNGRTPESLLETEMWGWHDMPSAMPDTRLSLPPDAMIVWTFNGRVAPFGPGGNVKIDAGPESAPWLSTAIAIEEPDCRLSAVTFTGDDESVQPHSMIVHIANMSESVVTLEACRLWTAQDAKTPRILVAGPILNAMRAFNDHAAIPAGEKGGFVVDTGVLPLTYAAVEVHVRKGDGEVYSLWAHLRIKKEVFDISGGWVNSKIEGKGPAVTHEDFLKTLKRLYVNTAHLSVTPGYSDTELYDKYPLKYFGAMRPIEQWDTDEMLPKIHAVECLGEPQYGGGRPVPPQEVWEGLLPYATSRLATTVTHSEERIWRDYAGLSDYPHYDAYRVTAPSADAWWKYDRWEKKIFWGSPLETIGDMCRSLRELNRPAPCAIWSQGPHEGWDRYGGRNRTSPTPDEIRLQAYHALSTRITSLYWFNLSLKTVVKWRDTLDEIARIGREMRLLDEFMIEGDAYGFERITKQNGELDWDIASVCGRRAALLFALDLDYAADQEEKVFKFGEPRDAEWRFPLPAYLAGIKDVFRLDADGIYTATWEMTDGAVVISEKASRVVVYVATPDPELRTMLEEKRRRLIDAEEALQFDPARRDEDFQKLVDLMQ